MIRYSKATLANTDLVTAQSFLFCQDDLYLIAIISALGDDVFTKVRQLSSKLEESFFESTDGVPQRLENLKGEIEKSLEDTEELKFLLGAFKESDSVFYLLGEGDHQAFLGREGKLSGLVPPEQNSQLISGFLQVGDRILVLNSHLGNYLSDSSKIELIKSPVSSFEEELSSFTLEHQAQDPLAAILVEYGQAVSEASPAAERIPSFTLKLAALSALLPYIRRSIPQSRRGKLVLAGALAVILFLGVFLTLRQKGISEQKSQFDNLVAQARSEYSRAQSLKDQDTSQAQISLSRARRDLQQALAIKPSDSQALSLKKEIEENTNSILKISKITDWRIYLDLGLVKKGFFSQRMSFSLGNILLLDPGQKTLIEIDLSKKSSQILAGSDQLGQASLQSLNGDFGFVYSGDKGIVRVDTKAQKSTVAIKPDPDWGKIIDLVGFSSNIYLLDSIKSAIWKYTPTPGGYSDKIPYLKPGVKADLTSGKRMLIDSSVWVLKSGSEIDRFTQGGWDSFSVAGLNQDIKDLTNFFISDQGDDLYLVDGASARMFVFKKNGTYLSQYQGDKFKTMSGFVVDERQKKLYLLEGDKIYWLDLK